MSTWIKMRTDLVDDPAIFRIAEETRLDPDSVIGKVFRFWTYGDRHTVDGQLAGLTPTWLDRYVGKRGFAVAMKNAGWLDISEGGLTIPKFDRHNGQSAKSRDQNTKRQQVSRSKRDQGATEARPEQIRLDLIAPAQSDVDWKSRCAEARAIARDLGECRSDQNVRLVLAACVIAEARLGSDWLNCAVRETKHARPRSPYAYLRKVLVSTGEAQGVDVKRSIASIDLPKRNGRSDASDPSISPRSNGTADADADEINALLTAQDDADGGWGNAPEPADEAHRGACQVA